MEMKEFSTSLGKIAQLLCSYGRTTVSQMRCFAAGGEPADFNLGLVLDC